MHVATGVCTCVAICHARASQKQAGSVHAVSWLCGSAALATKPAKHSLAPSDRAALVHVDGGCQRTRTFPSGQGKFWHFFFLGLPTRVGPHPMQPGCMQCLLLSLRCFFPRELADAVSVMSSSRVHVCLGETRQGRLRPRTGVRCSSSAGAHFLSC